MLSLRLNRLRTNVRRPMSTTGARAGAGDEEADGTGVSGVKACADAHMTIAVIDRHRQDLIERDMVFCGGLSSSKHGIFSVITVCHRVHYSGELQMTAAAAATAAPAAAVAAAESLARVGWPG